MQAERREWKAEQKVGAAERRKFHKEAKKRVIKRLMRPTLLDAVLAAVALLALTSCSFMFVSEAAAICS